MKSSRLRAIREPWLFPGARHSSVFDLLQIAVNRRRKGCRTSYPHGNPNGFLLLRKVPAQKICLSEEKEQTYRSCPFFSLTFSSVQTQTDFKSHHEVQAVTSYTQRVGRVLLQPHVSMAVKSILEELAINFIRSFGLQLQGV